MSFYKRFTCHIIVVMLLCSTICFSACGDENKNLIKDFAVYFIDVGEGDCIFINLPTGEKMLIDSGEKGKNNYESIEKVFDEYNVTKIDYLVITHPDGDHVGNARKIVDNYDIGLAYIPYIKDYSLLTEYSSFMTAINNKNITTKTSVIYETIKCEDCFISFLTPKEKDQVDSSYYIYNKVLEPSKAECNDLSPIIYLEYKGVRFVFTGDSGKSQEELVINSNKLNLYKTKFQNTNFNLEYIDFLKVSHHGADDGTSTEFLELLQPKNCVISVGGNNYYGHPATITLQNIIEQNEDCNIYRTDINGDIKVLVSSDGEVAVKKEA